MGLTDLGVDEALGVGGAGLVGVGAGRVKSDLDRREAVGEKAGMMEAGGASSHGVEVCSGGTSG